MARKSFENPLLSHARMRGLYRGLVEVRGLKLAPRGFEACLVAACIDLEDEDFVLSTTGPKAAAYVRSLGARTGSGAPRAAALRKSLAEAEPVFAGNAHESLLCAAGAAMALRSAPGRAVALTLTASKGLTTASLAQSLRATAATELPLIVVALPGPAEADWGVAGKRAGVPVIPVDAADTVAIYRVAQESLVRARADRRSAVIECIPSKADPIRGMGEQLLAKGIANQRWLDAVKFGFEQLLLASRRQPAA